MSISSPTPPNAPSIGANTPGAPTMSAQFRTGVIIATAAVVLFVAIGYIRSR